MDKKLINRIEQSRYSIDFCFYEIHDTIYPDTLTSPGSRVINALREAFVNRHIKVRVITDDENLRYTSRLRQVGIPVFSDSGLVGYSYTMHNKFAIFDYRDHSPLTPAWVWTGSYNASQNIHADNVMEIQSESLAEIYTLEFQQMWGSSGDLPNRDSARFHRRKKNCLPYRRTSLGEYEICVLFSPQDSALDSIQREIERASFRIGFCIFAFSHTYPKSKSLADLLRRKYSEGVWVGGVFCASEARQWWSSYLDLRDELPQYFRDSFLPVFKDKVPLSPPGGKLHHKFIVLDKRQVITGSMNWSAAGSSLSDENTLIIYGPPENRVALAYEQEFCQRFNEAGSDVGVHCILLPKGEIRPDTTLTPACSIYNYGIYPESYSVRMKVGDYERISWVFNHPSGTYQYVVFPPFNARWRGSWLVSCSTELNRDSDRNNDKIICALTVSDTTIWRQKAGLIHPSGIYRGAGCTDGRYYYLVGGWNGISGHNGPQSNFYRYDPMSDSWTELAPIPFPAANHCAVYHPGRHRIYVIGGYDGHNPMSNNQEYDISSNTWTQRRSLPDTVAGTAGVALGDDIYIVSSTSVQSKLFRYNIGTNSWYREEDHPQGVSYGQMVELDGKLYYAGSWPAGKNFHRYDPNTSTWESLPPMPVGRHGLGLATFDRRVYAYGGAQTWKKGNWVTVFDSRTGLWSVMSSMPFSLGANSVANSSPDSQLASKLYYTSGVSSQPGNVHIEGALRLSDVGVGKIEPRGVFDSGAIVVPSCSVYNYGTQVESYSVRFQIGGFYDQRESIVNHPPGQERYITFPSICLQTRGIQTVLCSTELFRDMVPGNDQRVDSVFVRVLDVAAIEIISPKDSIRKDSIFVPRAKVRNYGNTTVTPLVGLVFWQIDTIYKKVSNLTIAPESLAEITFSDTALSEGWYRMQLSTELSGDRHPENNLISDSFFVFAPSGLGEGVIKHKSPFFLSNPSRQPIFISYAFQDQGDASSKVKLEVYNITGTLVYSAEKSFSGGLFWIDKLPTGVYLLCLSIEGMEGKGQLRREERKLLIVK